MKKDYTPTIESLKGRLNALGVTKVYLTDIETNPMNAYVLKIDDINTDGKNLVISALDSYKGRKVEINKEILGIDHFTEGPYFEKVEPDNVEVIQNYSQVNISTGPDWHYKGIVMTFSKSN